jgi:hypothetical protein
MRQQRLLPATAAAAVLMLALTACSGNNSAGPGKSSASPVPSVTAAESTAPSEPSPSPTSETEVMKGTGIYVGQIDNHSVEIETEDGPTSFELGIGTENAPERLHTDDHVIFEYVEKTLESDGSLKQRILSKLSLEDTSI